MNKILRLGILGTASLWGISGYAAPNISAIEVDSDTSEIRITGSGFGEAPDVVVFDNFQRGVEFQKAELSLANHGAWTDDGWYGGIPDYFVEDDGNVSITARDNDYSLDSMSRIAQLQTVFPRTQKLFIAYSVKVPAGTSFAGASTLGSFPDVSSWKFTWVQNGKDAFQNSNLDLTLPTHSGGGNFILGGNDGNIRWLNSGSNWWSWSSFNNMSIGLDMSDPSQINYYWRNVSDKQYYDATGYGEKSKLNVAEFYVDRVGFPGWWGNGDNKNFNGIYDNLYVAKGDNYLARVEASNSSDPKLATSLVVVSSKAWSDSKIVLDTAVLEGFDVTHLSVVDANGTSSKSISVEICKKCPSTIIDIEVN
eukprot:TRINITY_DN18757_c0_g1_i1.p1 TRINITY_DN18757_c0_g1~~TRINITY_DN18757_c0_g1_i1.p1  ORF type:complete len:365 (+),score=-1.88 TRINITY_DN18757_c0_g1_i1:34-1128(+)